MKAEGRLKMKPAAGFMDGWRLLFCIAMLFFLTGLVDSLPFFCYFICLFFVEFSFECRFCYFLSPLTTPFLFPISSSSSAIIFISLSTALMHLLSHSCHSFLDLSSTAPSNLNLFCHPSLHLSPSCSLFHPLLVRYRSTVIHHSSVV